MLRRVTDEVSRPAVGGSATPAQHDVSKPRKVTSPQELRALAHPLRLRLLEELVVNDPATDTATASELAERVGESPANCSWHLRQLAKFGYIEEAPGGTGRERRWRAVIEMHDWDTANSRDPEFLAAADVAQDIVMDHEFQQLRQRRAWLANEPEEWRSAAGSLSGIGWCTAEELREISNKIFEILAPSFQRLTDPEARPEGARLVRFVNWAIPARPYVHDNPPTRDRTTEAPDA
jgi:DNA-binding transcriptional ArsR family regulator